MCENIQDYLIRSEYKQSQTLEEIEILDILYFVMEGMYL